MKLLEVGTFAENITAVTLTQEQTLGANWLTKSKTDWCLKHRLPGFFGVRLNGGNMFLKPTDCRRRARNLCSSCDNTQKPPWRNFFVWNKQVAALKSAILFITSICCILSSNPPRWWGKRKKNLRTYSNYLTWRRQGEIKRENVFKKWPQWSTMSLICFRKRGERPQTLDLSDATQLSLDYRPLMSP